MIFPVSTAKKGGHIPNYSIYNINKLSVWWVSQSMEYTECWLHKRLAGNFDTPKNFRQPINFRLLQQLGGAAAPPSTPSNTPMLKLEHTRVLKWNTLQYVRLLPKNNTTRMIRLKIVVSTFV